MIVQTCGHHASVCCNKTYSRLQISEAFSFGATSGTDSFGRLGRLLGKCLLRLARTALRAGRGRMRIGSGSSTAGRHFHSQVA